MNRPDDELLQGYLDGQLNAAETAALQRRLHAEPALADQLVALAREEAILIEWAHSDQAARLADRAAIQSSRRLLLPRRWAYGLAAAAVAATLLAAVLTGWFDAGFAPAYAELEDVSGEVFIVGASGESTAARPGSRLTTGQSLRTGGEGSFAVVVSDSTRLELGADTSIRLTSEPRGQARVFLEQGSVAADVTRTPVKPMLLATPHGEALVETRSSFLSVPEGTRIEPEAGPVRFRKVDGESVAVPAGWYAVALPAPANPMVPRPLPNRPLPPRTIIEDEDGPIQAGTLSPDGSLLAAGGADGSVKIYETAAGTLLQQLKPHRGPVRALAFSPDGSVLASGSNDRKVQLTDPRTGKEVGKLAGYKGPIESIAFSPRGDLLATGGIQPRELPEVKIWSLTTRQEVANLEHHSMPVLAVAFSPDGATLATAGRDHMIHLVDLATWTVRTTLDGHRAPVTAIAFSPDGSMLVSGGRDRTLRLWDTAAGIQSSVLTAQANPVRALAFSPDGRLLAAGDVAVRLYDWKSGQERLILKGHKKQISSVAFSPDGKLIATTSLDKTIRLWEMTPDG